MGNTETSVTETPLSEENSHTVYLTWIPSSKSSDTVSTYSFVMTTSKMKTYLWELLKEKLVSEGKSVDVMFVLENILLKYENGNPVYGEVFIGTPTNMTIKSYDLSSKDVVKIKAFETE
jgi:hypothetical protein